MAKKKKSVKKAMRKRNNDLTIHFMPYSEIARESSLERIKKIMGIILKHKIIILQGRLRADEEARLIENSMTLIGNIEGFQGIEIAAISGEEDRIGVFERIRTNLARILVGEKDAITIIGPASVVKDITRDPKKIELMLNQR